MGHLQRQPARRQEEDAKGVPLRAPCCAPDLHTPHSIQRRPSGIFPARASLLFGEVQCHGIAFTEWHSPVRLGGSPVTPGTDSSAIAAGPSSAR